MLDTKSNLLYQLDKRVDEGLINRSKKGDLLIYSYTPSCQFDKKWDDYTKRARSLVVDKDGNIISEIFPKFFNINEMLETKVDALEGRDFEIFEKLDGSLFNLMNYKGEWIASTKGSLDNEYITFGLTQLPDMSNIPKNYVFACEVCMPKELDGMKRAVNHEPGIYLLAGFDKHQEFRELDIHKVRKLWQEAGGNVAKLYPPKSLDELIKATKTEELTEGWVLRFKDNGQRVKIKTLWYLRLFSFINSLDDKFIKEMMKFYGVGSNEWFKDVPEELLDEIKETTFKLRERYYDEIRLINNKFETYKAKSQTKKDFALQVKDDEHFWALFNIWDSKPYEDKILDKL